jgi:hypothetical protein
MVKGPSRLSALTLLRALLVHPLAQEILNASGLNVLKTNRKALLGSCYRPRPDGPRAEDA